MGKLHKRVSEYNAFSLKGTDIAKRSIECMYLSKPFNVRYFVSLRSKLIAEIESRDFHVIFENVLPVMPIKKMLKYTKLQKDIPHSKRHRMKLHKGFLIAPRRHRLIAP